jgi:Flp pilus assembly pilin Flp
MCIYFGSLKPFLRVKFGCLAHDVSGQTMVEYVLMLLLLALVVILALPAVANGISQAFLKIAASLTR